MWVGHVWRWKVLRFYLFNPANLESRGLVCVDPANRLMLAKMKILLAFTKICWEAVAGGEGCWGTFLDYN